MADPHEGGSAVVCRMQFKVIPRTFHSIEPHMPQVKSLIDYTVDQIENMPTILPAKSNLRLVSLLGPMISTRRKLL